YAFGINNNGLVVGTDFSGMFFWDGTTREDVLEAYGTVNPVAVNDLGQVAITVNDAPNGVGAAAVFKNGVVTFLGSLGGNSPTQAFGMNNAGQIVGSSNDAERNYPSAFLWEINSETGEGEIVDLNDLIPPDTGLHLYRAYRINDSGQIVGLAVDENNHDHPFLLTPLSGIMVDANRDGEITFDGQDETTKERPFRFWVNDDSDAVGVFDTGEEDDVQPGTRAPDHVSEEISCKRDLEDFTRIHIKLPPSFDPADPSCRATLRFVDVNDGIPSINVWKAVSPSLDYLTDENVADQMLARQALVTVSSLKEYPLPSSAFEPGASEVALLFEAKSVGKGAL
ncbi:MAG: hypothetical protein L0287_37680, partial [Anaerolineae bacterium]|nr:hypothetical protein [Anaerolineae bacterium]